MDRLSDTRPEMVALLVERWRQVGPEEKLAMVGRMNRAALALAQRRQDEAYPDATPEERRLRLASLWLDDASLRRWWGWDPATRGR